VIYETRAILSEGAPQSWNLPYLNLVLLGSTELEPEGLLDGLQEIERQLGRDHTAPRWAPRTLDLDILAWGDRIIESRRLKVPHPELLRRPFLLPLMASLDAGWRYPASGPHRQQSLAEMVHHSATDLVESVLRCYAPAPQMMGIVNVTPNSFSDGGQHLDAECAMERIRQLVTEGAAVIDIGAHSTAKGKAPISMQEEWSRLEPLLQLLGKELASWQAKPLISLDSFYPEVVERALMLCPIDWINDVTGGRDSGFLRLLASTECRIVLGHSLSVPPSRREILPFDSSPIRTVYRWAEEKLEEYARAGVERDRVILDPGVGFGKTPFQSIQLLREVEQLHPLGCEILAGHSRKLNLLAPTAAAERDLQTMGMSHSLFRKGVDYLRVHDVQRHQELLAATILLEGGCS